MSASGTRLKHFGWGREGEGLSEDEEVFMLARAEARRSAAARGRTDTAPLPAEIRIFHAGRLDRDARRRALRDALHPHRRFRGIAAHRHAEAA
jgi:hypothetical protein